MATNISISKNGSAVMRKILLKLEYNTTNGLKRHCYTVESANPEAVSDADWTSMKVKVGNFVYRIDDNEVFICSVANASATSAQFIQCHV